MLEKRSAMPIRLAQTDADIQNCFPVMVQLRPHLVEEEFVARVRKQEKDGYRLVLFEEDGKVQAVSGFRTGESLSRGAFLYIDDLVTDESGRSQGFGQQLFDWIGGNLFDFFQELFPIRCIWLDHPASPLSAADCA